MINKRIQLLVLIGLFSPRLSNAQSEAFIFQSSVVEKVVAYNTENDQMSLALQKARTAKSIDTVRLKFEIKDVVKKCFQVPQEYIAENPSSQYSLQALKMLGTGTKNSPVQIAELERLFNSLSDGIKNSREGQTYALQLKSWPWLNRLKSAAGSTFIRTSLSPALVKNGLLEAAGRIASVSSLSQWTHFLVEEREVLDRLNASTLVASMAYVRPEDQTLQVNPTTAYVIDETGICVTNYHVFQEYTSKEMYQSFSVMTADGKAYPLTKILACSESDDLVVFQVDTRGDRLFALPLGSAVAETAAVHVMSHPIGSFYRFTSGVVAGYSTSTLVGKPCNVMNITADFNVGSSGGPIVDRYGNVVGTVSRLNGEKKIGIPVNELKKLIEFR